jgi:TIR domain
MSGIFLSYRRDDASGWAGRLYEHLVTEWGPGQVFMDIDAIAPGEDFREAIAHTMQTCDVVLVVIGPNWVDARDYAGNRRLDDEGDTHRREVAAALAADVRIIPVLVGGATMPKLSDLPDPLKDLVYRNAAVIEDRRFASDVRALQDALRQFAEQLAARPDTGDTGEQAVSTSKIGGLRQSETRPRPPGRRSGLHAPRVGGESSVSRAGASLTTQTVLAIVGAAVVLIWGVFWNPGWHDELWGIRAGASLVLVVLTVVGLLSRQWRWVLLAGIGGLVGLGIWLLQLAWTHPDEMYEIFGGPPYDGIPNFITLAGALLVLVAGWLGTKASATRR